ncbi:MAG: hypothetical protein AAF327_16475, partial [Cyanobacteria bacterium P01_A01_bin.37]
PNKNLDEQQSRPDVFRIHGISFQIFLKKLAIRFNNTTWQRLQRNKGLGRATRDPIPYFFVAILRRLPSHVSKSGFCRYATTLKRVPTVLGIGMQ